MPRLSLPRQAPRAILPRKMPGPFVHTYFPRQGMTGGSEGIRLNPASYTTAIHDNYFVQKSWAMEMMWKPAPEYAGYVKLISDQDFRTTQYGSRLGTVIQIIGGPSGGGIQMYFTDSSKSQMWGVSGGFSPLTTGKWTHIAISYVYNAADPAASRFKLYVDGYNNINYAGYVGQLNTPYLGNLRKISYVSNLDLLGCAGGNHQFKYFRMLDYDPWPDGGFETPDPYNSFKGTGTWKPGINVEEPYPTIDPSHEIVKFDFSNKQTIDDIVDQSPNNFTVDKSLMTGSTVQFAP